jgi:Mn-containing catalase
MLTGTSDESAVNGQVGVTLRGAKERRLSHHFIVSGLGALAANSLGQPWQGDYVFNSGDLVLDLLHNFFLESGAGAQKIRVYELTNHPIARQMLGYLLVRGGVHQVAYAKALEELTGVEVPKMLNIPNISNSKFPETRQWEERGLHRVLYRFSEDDYQDVEQVWRGTIPRTARRSGSSKGRRRARSGRTCRPSPASASRPTSAASWRRSRSGC